MRRNDADDGVVDAVVVVDGEIGRGTGSRRGDWRRLAAEFRSCQT